MQKLCCRQKAPPFFPTAFLLPSQHNFYQHIRGEMLSATFLPFALFDSNDHSFAIDIGNFQAGSLRNAQSRSVAGRQDSAMLDALKMRKFPILRVFSKIRLIADVARNRPFQMPIQTRQDPHQTFEAFPFN